MSEEESAGWVQQALKVAAGDWCGIGLALGRQQGMLQYSPPAQAGATAAARMNSASRRWIHCVTIDFICFKYRITAEWMSTGKAGEVMGAEMMNHRTGRIRFPTASWFLAGLLCMASIVGCTDTNVLPASKIVDAYGKVTLSWNPVPTATSYHIYFSSASGATKLSSYRIPNVSNPLTITDLVLGKTYYFGISVVDPSGESIILSEKTYTVRDKDGLVDFGDLTPKIQNLKIQAHKAQVQKGHVSLSWDNVPNAVSYNIYYSDSQGVTKQKGKKIANVKNPYTIKGLKRGKIYYVVVTAVTNLGEGRESQELSFAVKP